MLRFLRKFPQIVKDLFRFVQDTVSAAFLVENRHEVSLIGAAAFISVSKGTDVLLFHAREVLVQLGVKIFSVTLPERYAHSKHRMPLTPASKQYSRMPRKFCSVSLRKGRIGESQTTVGICRLCMTFSA